MAQSRFTMKRESDYDVNYNLDSKSATFSNSQLISSSFNTININMINEENNEKFNADNKYDKGKLVASSTMKLVKFLKQTGMSNVNTWTQLTT